MKTESTDIISCYCWDKNPEGPGRCTDKPGHKGHHYDPYARSSWDRPGASWPNR
ncbi:hypothetical protein [Streptomyces sp. NPDC048473]|uniref:hypothetical protein n=1 Tax=unclassified Streptomyces TaxID=2593676 RepID=UPI003713A583